MSMHLDNERLNITTGSDILQERLQDGDNDPKSATTQSRKKNANSLKTHRLQGR